MRARRLARAVRHCVRRKGPELCPATGGWRRVFCTARPGVPRPAQATIACSTAPCGRGVAGGDADWPDTGRHTPATSTMAPGFGPPAIRPLGTAVPPSRRRSVPGDGGRVQGRDSPTGSGGTARDNDFCRLVDCRHPALRGLRRKSVSSSLTVSTDSRSLLFRGATSRRRRLGSSWVNGTRLTN